MLGRLIKVAAKSMGWIIGLCMLSMMISCSGTEIGNPDTDPISPTDSNIEPLSSEALETYLKEQYANSVNFASPGLNGAIENDGGTPPNSDNNSDTPTSGNFSQTNNQEQGVEESDVVKTDGVYFYVADDRSFSVVDISGAMEVIATRPVDGYIEALYLYGNKLVILYRLAPNGAEPGEDIAMPVDGRLFGMPYWIPVEKRQGVAIYDISDPHDPTNLKTVDFDGHLISSRLINGKLHVVQQFRPNLPPLDYWHDGTAQDMDNKIKSNQQALDEMTLNDMIPFYRVASDPPDAQTDTPTVTPNHYYCPASKDGGGTITTIVSFDLDDADLPFESIGMVADAHIVYASTQALYTATHKYLYDAKTATTSQEATLFKFDITGDAVRFAGGGIIPGWILNQFSLGEYQGVLRVATTTGHAGGWQETSRNNVYCLQSENNTLKVIGKIEDLAPGEQIYAARFMGERGYLVTYVKVDPLFTLNLSDPSAPEVAGYLKVPGYSDYIHPYGDNYLITVGKDALFMEEDNMTWYQGVQLSIFDISDFSNPTRLHHQIIGNRGTNTEVSGNHKAFTFLADNELMALPIDLYEHITEPAHPSIIGEKTFQGLYVYRVSPDSGFQLLGRMSTERDTIDAGYRHWTRGIFVDPQVYAVTKDAVHSAQTDQIEERIQTVFLK